MYMQVSLCAPEKNYREGPTQNNDINRVEFTREQTEVKILEFPSIENCVLGHKGRSTKRFLNVRAIRE